LKAALLILIFIISTGLYSSITVEYYSNLSPEIIYTTEIEGVKYFNVFELNKAFKAFIKEDIIDHRLRINIYGCQLILLMESSFLTCNGDIYNFKHPLIQNIEIRLFNTSVVCPRFVNQVMLQFH